MVDKAEAYKKAEQLSKEIISACVEKGLTLQEFHLLKTALQYAIDDKTAEIMSKTKLT